MIHIDHKKKIDNSEWVNERLSEVFDDATDMMTEGAIVYGGAIRDVLAGQELEGDIDIAVNFVEYNEVVSRFNKNAKWVSNNRSLSKNMPEYRNNKTPGWMNNLSSFVHMNGHIAQIISVNTDETWSVVRGVDIVCCGVMMLYDGQVFEIIEGAYDDCVGKVLRLNKIKNIDNINETPIRIKKLVGRGWKSLITNKQIERVIARNKKTASVGMGSGIKAKMALKFKQRHPIITNPAKTIPRAYGSASKRYRYEDITVMNDDPQPVESTTVRSFVFDTATENGNEIHKKMADTKISEYISAGRMADTKISVRPHEISNSEHESGIRLEVLPEIEPSLYVESTPDHNHIDWHNDGREYISAGRDEHITVNNLSIKDRPEKPNLTVSGYGYNTGRILDGDSTEAKQTDMHTFFDLDTGLTTITPSKPAISIDKTITNDLNGVFADFVQAKKSMMSTLKMSGTKKKRHRKNRR